MSCKTSLSRKNHRMIRLLTGETLNKVFLTKSRHGK